MPILIGLDEAGYGPNLGPLLIAATVWEIPTPPAECDLYTEFAEIVGRPNPSPRPQSQPAPLTMGDSKQIHTPGQGLAALEVPVWHAFALQSSPDSPPTLPRTLPDLLRLVALNAPLDPPHEPWSAAEVPLPQAPSATDLVHLAAWRSRCAERKIHLRHLAADVVSPLRFNALNRQTGSKGRSLTELSLRLVARCLDQLSQPRTPVLILADKHGGRNRYHEFLPAVVGDTFITCLEESTQLSRYRAGPFEFRFQTQSERHLPTALASMLAKYLRELSMLQFNTWWQAQIPGLKATAGYPVDAARFRRDIAARQAELGIPDDILWREK
jgi:ribonuclease HII